MRPERAPDTPVRQRLPVRSLAVLALFVLSGAGSLMDQVVWLRYLSLSFGNTTYAAATLLAVFMGGLGLGALLFGRLADRLRRPLAVFAAVQVGVALFAMASPWLFDGIDAGYVWLYRTWGAQPLLFAVGRAVLAAFFLLPPTLLMGGTLPLILRAVTAAPASDNGVAGTTGTVRHDVGRVTALAYALNTLGAVCGVALAGFLTIRLLGLYATLLLAAGFDLTAGLGCLLLSRTVGREEEPAPTDAASISSGPPESGNKPAPPSRRLRWALLGLFFFMGASSLALEVLWTRILVFFLGSSVYAYSLMLLLFLLGVGAGSLLLTPWVDRLRSPLVALAVLEAALGAWALAQVGLFQHLNDLLAWTAERSPWQEGFSALVLTQLVALLPVLLPPTLLMGASFPLAVRALHQTDPERVGWDVGRVYGANTLGSVVGSLTAGFLCIPLLGTQNSLVVVGAVNALLAAVVLWMLVPRSLSSTWLPRGARWAAVALPVLIVASILWLPPDRVILSAGLFAADRPGDLLYFHEDASATVTIRRQGTDQNPYEVLELNGVNVAGTSSDLYAVQKMQGHLPLILADAPKRVAHIGFGSGGTAWAVSRHPVEEIRIIEISQAVLDASGSWFGHINHDVLRDPRVVREINDGRNYLLASERTFDAVLSDSIHPRYSGNGSLYSLEYFRLLRARLEPGGVASMWLPTYALTPRNFQMVVKAFAEVFAEPTVWYEPSALNSFTIVTGRVEDTDGRVRPWNPRQLQRVFHDPRVSGELADLGVHGPAEVLGCYVLGGDRLRAWLADVPPHTDDLPAVEYESGTLVLRDFTWLVTFTKLLEQRPASVPARYLEGLDIAEQARAQEVYDAYGRRMQEHRELLLSGMARALGLRRDQLPVELFGEPALLDSGQPGLLGEAGPSVRN